jgi:hypothetical protein
MVWYAAAGGGVGTRSKEAVYVAGEQDAQEYDKRSDSLTL